MGTLKVVSHSAYPTEDWLPVVVHAGMIPGCHTLVLGAVPH